MAEPNIVNVTSIYGKTNGLNVSSGASTLLLGSNTNHVRKINSIYVSNTSATTTSVNVNTERGGVSYYLAYEIDIPPKTTLVVTDNKASFYLTETDSLKAQVLTSGNTISTLVSYDEIDDA